MIAAAVLHVFRFVLRNVFLLMKMNVVFDIL